MVLTRVSRDKITRKKIEGGPENCFYRSSWQNK